MGEKTEKLWQAGFGVYFGKGTHLQVRNKPKHEKIPIFELTTLLKFEMNKRKTPMSKNKLLKITKVMLGLIVGITITMLILLVGLFHFKKDDIARYFLTSSNQYLNGNLSFDEISLSSVLDPTNFVIDIQNLIYQLSDTSSSEKPLISAKHLLVELNLKSMIQGEIEIDNIEIMEGDVSVLQFQDSTFNFSQIIKKDGVKNDSVERTVGLSLKQIELSNINFLYESKVSKKLVKLGVSTLALGVFFSADSVSLHVKTAGEIQQYNRKKGQWVPNILIQLEASVFKQVQDTVYTIPQFELAINDAYLIGDGYVPINFPNLYSFAFSGKNNLDLLKIFLTPKAANHIHKGDVNFTGTLKGLSHRQIPYLDIITRIDHMQIDVPDLDYTLSDLNFRAQVNTGVASKMQDARVKLDTLSVVFPNGYAHLAGSMEDVSNPKVSFKVNSNVNLHKVSQLFKMDKLKDVAGDVELSLKYDGQRNIDRSWKSSSLNSIILCLNNLSFSMPGIGSVSGLYGNVHGNMDSMLIDTLYFKTGNSDIALSGFAQHVAALFVESGSETLANLHIRANQLDLPEFLQYYPAVKKGFDYRFRQVDLQTHIQIPNKQWHHHIKTPTINFTFSDSKCLIDSFLPPIRFSDGVFLLTEDTSRTLLNFKGFSLILADAQLDGDFQYIISDSIPPFLQANFAFKNLNPFKTFKYYTSNLDSINDFRISGQLFSSLTLSGNENPNHFMEDILFTGDKLTLKSETDSVQLQKITLITNEITLRNIENSLFFNKIKSSGNLAIQGLKYKEFFMDSIHALLDVDGGVIELNNYYTDHQLYKGNGSITLQPFTYPPSYGLNIVINQFKIEQFMDKIQQPKFIEGDVQLEINLHAKGSQKDTLFQSLKGNIEIGGDSLIMYGVDIDAFIQKLSRSQNFSLADVGAVMLAGPAGLLLTKGSDITKLLITNNNDSSLITQLSNKWNIQDGILTARDVALATTHNRVALKGEYELNDDQIEVAIAVLDPNGCSAIRQNIKGSISKPELGELQILKTLLKPVTNLVVGVLDNDCDPFYKGEVKHPQ